MISESEIKKKFGYFLNNLQNLLELNDSVSLTNLQKSDAVTLCTYINHHMSDKVIAEQKLLLSDLDKGKYRKYTVTASRVGRI